jgi:hypothetical protein
VARRKRLSIIAPLLGHGENKIMFSRLTDFFALTCWSQCVSNYSYQAIELGDD